MRTALTTLLFTAGSLCLAQTAHGAVHCRPVYSDGKVHIICNETGQNRFTCSYELPIEYNKARTTLTGKFDVPRGARDLRPLSLTQYKGQRITGIGKLNTSCSSKPVVAPETKE